MQEITISAAAARAIVALCYEFLSQGGYIHGITSDEVMEAGEAFSNADRIIIAKEEG